MFFLLLNNGFRRLFYPGLDKIEMGKIFLGSYTHKKGDIGMVWGESKPISNGITGMEHKI